MKIKHLYYFLVVANTKSINQAAQKLFISQQHLSRIIASIEEELQIKLFIRTSTGIELTEKGQVFSTYAERIVNDYREMQNYFYLDALPAVEQKDDLQGNCQIAFPFFFSLFLNDFIQELHDIHPGITIQYFEDAREYTAELFTHSQMLHIVVEHKEQIQSLLKENDMLTSYCIGETRLSFCINKHSPLAIKPVLTQGDIDHQIVTMYPQKSNYVLLQNANILFVSSNIYQHLDSVVHHQSICLVPSYIQTGIQQRYPDIVLRPFEQQFTIPMYIIYSKDLLLTDADKTVIQFAAQYMQKINAAAPF